MTFFNARNDRSNFVMSWTGDPQNDFSVFARGYGRAANHLANKLLESPHFSDYDAYPVVFLYRHALELALKHIIYRSAKLGRLRDLDAIKSALHNNHRLQALMAAASASLDLLFPGDSFLANLIPKCRRTCDELSGIDNDSFTFRYPMDTKGRYPTKPHLVLNLGSIAEHMSALLDELDTVQFGLNAEIDLTEDALELAIRDGLRAGSG